MKSRLLTTTAALSVALSTIQPLPVRAQEAARDNCTAENAEDCEPRKRGERRSGEEDSQQDRRNRPTDAAGQQQEEPSEGQRREKRAKQAEEEAGGAARASDRERPAREKRAKQAEEEAGGADRASDAERPAREKRAKQAEEKAEGADRASDAERPAREKRAKQAEEKAEGADRASDAERPAREKRDKQAEEKAEGADRASDAERPAREKRGKQPEDEADVRPAEGAKDAERPARSADGERSRPQRGDAPEREEGDGEADRASDRERQQRRAAPIPEEDAGASERTDSRDAEPGIEVETPRAERARTREDAGGPDGDELRRILEEEAEGGAPAGDGDRPTRRTDENDSPVAGTDSPPREGEDPGRRTDETDSPVADTERAPRDGDRPARRTDETDSPVADTERAARDGDRPAQQTEEDDGPVADTERATREGDRPPQRTDENDSPVAGADRATRDRARPDEELDSPAVDEAEPLRREDARDADADRRPTEGGRATGDAERAEEEREPSREEARRSLSRALDEQEASTAAAAASAGSAREAAEDARSSARRAERITEEDFRSSREDFATRATDSRSGEDDDDDDDGGLSNFEKFGLLALGGLAVGALLNNRDEVVSNSGDRVVVQRADGTYAVLKDDDTLLRRPGSEVITESYADGSTRSIVTREDGTQIVTIRDAAGRVLRRSAVDRYGQEVLLIDDLAPVEQIDFSRLPEPAPVYNFTETRDKAALREALEQMRGRDLDRTYSLRQIRDYREVRALAPAIDVDQITFDSGSAAIVPEEAEKLAMLGQTISDMIAERPEEVFLIEGHTDAVGSAASNLTLSDRRAESVALALTEYYDVPPENLVVQGYGEEDLRVDTEGPDQRNRRVAVRLITPLLQTAAN
ncbi:OmpA family protein [Cereibacter sphaeroides]|uniref:OmpA family protein n=1 Tax=Cereibacter sphaeroides TaxID=1063 RepID=UPI001F1869BE|nr:OmpA family protein [Cereibacter sphaeroides]MCE6959035.1 OmpA family protein [Cereibacter sphaeroides]MCE6973623.1 OmpA family protein [Cereibacter sphaeroides]